MLRNTVLSCLALAMLALGGLWLSGRAPDPAMTLLTAAPALAQETAAEGSEAVSETAPVVEELVLGNADAPVTIVEYASYTCPHCANFHAEVFKKLKTDYIDTGKVKFVFREVYFDRYGLWASMMARCGGNTRYFGISGMLFEEQKEWAASNDPAVVVENIKTIGRKAGMDDATLQACLEDAEMAQALVTAFEKNMAADGVEGTPTLFVNGTKHGNMSYDELRALIDEALAG
jgi:protein-disulfide isomerase